MKDKPDDPVMALALLAVLLLLDPVINTDPAFPVVRAPVLSPRIVIGLPLVPEWVRLGFSGYTPGATIKRSPGFMANANPPTIVLRWLVQLVPDAASLPPIPVK
jgi:hypothetical protein